MCVCVCVGAPLFGCADMVELKAGDNELMVSCRIVSIHEDLMSVRVRIYEGTGESFIIEPDVTSQRTEKTYEADNRYMVTVEPRPFTVRIHTCCCIIYYIILYYIILYYIILCYIITNHIIILYCIIVLYWSVQCYLIATIAKGLMSYYVCAGPVRHTAIRPYIT